MNSGPMAFESGATCPWYVASVAVRSAPPLTTFVG